MRTGFFRQVLTLLLFGLGLAGMTACRGEEPGTGASRGSAMPAPASAKPLPPSAFRIEWAPPAIPSVMGVGRSVPVRIELRNAGDTVWPDAKQASSDGRNAVRLAYRWKDPTGKKVLRDYDNRTDLPKPLPAGESLSLTVDVKTPAEKGRALLQVDLVQEGVAWFESKGAAPLVVTVEVQ